MLYLIPVFIVLLFIVVFVLFFSRSFSDLEKTKADGSTVKELYQELQKISNKQEELDRRMTNMEHILADDRFEKPLEPKESINMKKEMDELKIMIERIAKK